MWTTSTILVEYDDINYPIYLFKNIYNNNFVSDIKKKYFKENPFDLSEEENKEIWAWFKEYFLDIIDVKYLKTLSKIVISNDFSQNTKKELVFWISCVSDRVMADLTVNMIFEASKNENKRISKEKLCDYADKLTHLEKRELEKAVNNYIFLLETCDIARSEDSSIILNNFVPSEETFAFALFYLFDQKQIPVNILRSYKFKYILLDINDVMEYLKILKKKEMIKFVVKKESFELAPKIDFNELPALLEK